MGSLWEIVCGALVESESFIDGEARAGWLADDIVADVLEEIRQFAAGRDITVSELLDELRATPREPQVWEVDE